MHTTSSATAVPAGASSASIARRTVRTANPVSGTLPASELGQQIYRLASEIYPINRSLTGSGVAETLKILGQIIPVQITRVPSGTKVYDWTVPDEWNVEDAYLENEHGERLVDLRQHSLHVLGYSQPVDVWLSREDLATHLYSIPTQPDLIPYRTSYYSKNWGFCIPDTLRAGLPDARYHAVIKSTIAPGHLTWGECFIKGDSDQEILLSAHVCHPSMANDNCSGLAALTVLARYLQTTRPQYSYRFLFAPGTLGALCWLAQNEHRLNRFHAGLVVSCLGDHGGPTYKRSRRGNSSIDRAMSLALHERFPGAIVNDFSPYGYDERQYCSPGFNLPVGSLQRSQWGSFPEYHTSADNLDFIKPEALEESVRLMAQALDCLDGDWRPVNLSPKGEPQLGARGLYGTVGGNPVAPSAHMAMLWTLNLADGRSTLMDIAECSGLPFSDIAEAASKLETAGLLGDGNTSKLAPTACD